jgi:heme oxygenase
MKDIRYFKSRLGDVHQGNYSLFYTDHIKNLKDPYLIIAHSYVRYLGDLSGGQILKNIVQKNYHLEGEEGVSFYNFQNIKDISQFKVHYKNILDALDLDNDTKIEIIEEAKTVFQLNNQLFSKLDSFIGISSS